MNPSPRPQSSVTSSNPAIPVEADQDIIEVETNKANMNVVSPVRGTIEKFSAQLGESYAVGRGAGRN